MGPAPRTRVLIVDDSSFIRRMLTDILSADPEIEVVGAAANAAMALEKLEANNPDVITLDVEMPDMSGLDLLVEIRKRAPKVPVIMFSALTQRAASVTLEALGRGATDYVTKPSTNSREASIDHVRNMLLPKVKGLGFANHGPISRTVSPIRVAERSRGADRFDVLAIGASTGGPNALLDVLMALPTEVGLPVVVVQHMPPLFTQILAERLTKHTRWDCREAADGMTLEPGRVLVAPGDHHLKVVRKGTSYVAMLDRGPPENSCRPAVDVLFRSVAETFGAHALGVVLTGMGSDGVNGCEAIQRAGGLVAVQDEASSVVWGMPGFVAQAGFANAILPLTELAPYIATAVQRRAKGLRHAG